MISLVSLVSPVSQVHPCSVSSVPGVSIIPGDFSIPGVFGVPSLQSLWCLQCLYSVPAWCQCLQCRSQVSLVSLVSPVFLMLSPMSWCHYTDTGDTRNNRDIRARDTAWRHRGDLVTSGTPKTDIGDTMQGHYIETPCRDTDRYYSWRHLRLFVYTPYILVYYVRVIQCQRSVFN